MGADRVDTSLPAVACACGGQKDGEQDTPAETLTVGSALPSSGLVSLLLGTLGRGTGNTAPAVLGRPWGPLSLLAEVHAP